MTSSPGVPRSPIRRNGPVARWQRPELLKDCQVVEDAPVLDDAAIPRPWDRLGAGPRRAVDEHGNLVESLAREVGDRAVGRRVADGQQDEGPFVPRPLAIPTLSRA
jgi:hypothetical protein